MSVVISSEFGVYRGCTSPEREQRPWNSILLLTNKLSLSLSSLKENCGHFQNYYYPFGMVLTFCLFN